MQKQEKIIEMFNQIAPTYDRANRILSLGADVSWRKKACARVLELCEGEDLSIVDVACGTGDMIGFWQQGAKNAGRKIHSIRGIDPSSAMLEIAKNKFKNVPFIQAGAELLPLEDARIDIISISYGIRNVVKRTQALQEFVRVLKSGGFLLVLEFTQRKSGGLMGRVRDFYLVKILPILGGIISKNKSAYAYLPASIEGFLSAEGLMGELEGAGFEILEFKSFSFGVSSMFIARKV